MTINFLHFLKRLLAVFSSLKFLQYRASDIPPIEDIVPMDLMQRERVPRFSLHLVDTVWYFSEPRYLTTPLPRPFRLPDMVDSGSIYHFLTMHSTLYDSLSCIAILSMPEYALAEGGLNIGTCKTVQPGHALAMEALELLDYSPGEDLLEVSHCHQRNMCVTAIASCSLYV